MKLKNTILKRFVTLMAIVSCCTVLSQEIDKDLFYTTEIQLSSNEYSNSIENFYDKGEDGYFIGKKSIKIYFNVFRQPQAKSPAIVISSGRTEAAIKYKELIYDLYNNGYSVYILDHRGQGQSGRMTKDPDMGYVETFQFYIDDMKSFYSNYVVKGNHTNYFLLAHSMGGAIGMSYLEQYPTDFDAAAFSSPMLGLPFGICGGAKLLEPKQPTYGLGEGEYSEEDQKFKRNILTGSEIRYNRMVEAFDKVPEARLGGATYHWVVESCDQFEYINSHVKNIQTPFILFSAENEEIVSLNAHTDFVKRAQEMGKSCELVFIENAQHELLIEKDPQRKKVLEKIINFYSK